MEMNTILSIIILLVILFIVYILDYKINQPWKTYFRLFIPLSLLIIYWFYGGESSSVVNVLVSFLLAYNIIVAVLEYISWNKKSKIKQP